MSAASRLATLLRASCLAAALALAGCAGMPLPGSETAEVVELLRYHERLGTLPPAELRREQHEAQAELERAPGDFRRLKLALALLAAKASWRDDGRVLQLLAGMEAAPAEQASPRRDLAQLIHKLVGERQRLWRDEGRKVDALQQKLDALREIDRDSRPAPPRRRAP